ncbi:MAG: Gfo/Idh/MocA family oxidoreductase [bacterium]|nr:Gfo/Idh/MocA family oxidoreductase [bacterium]MCP5070014.1 Gfo/Idh/MocA family oxidoreductase [bacterium]
MIGVAVVGCGYWGPNVVRNFSQLPECELRALCDLDRDRLSSLGRLYPGCRLEQDFERLLRSPDIDAIAVCTPVASHFAIASAALAAGKHVLVEKPLADTVEHCEKLIDLAAQNGLILQVDHTFVYSEPVRAIRSMLRSGHIGDLLYFDSVRINLGLFRPDVNVIWDLAVHDVSIINCLIPQKPLWVSCIGIAHYGRFESQAYMTIRYENSLLAHIHVNWLAPVKLRTTVIGGSKRMIVYEDLSPSEKLRIYEKGVTTSEDPDIRKRALVDYRLGNMTAPHLEKTEPLREVCREFLRAVDGGPAPLTPGEAGLAVVRILEAAQRSVRNSSDRVLLGD